MDMGRGRRREEEDSAFEGYTSATVTEMVAELGRIGDEGRK